MPKRILIADDNALVRSALRSVLEVAGRWDVVETQNGKEAVEKAQEAKPDLIILDLAMPLMDGMTAARQLVKLVPEVPILMHTLYWSPRIEVEALRIGVRKIVPKSESSAIISAVLTLLQPEGTEPAADSPGSNLPATIPLIPARGAKPSDKPGAQVADGGGNRSENRRVS